MAELAVLRGEMVDKEIIKGEFEKIKAVDYEEYSIPIQISIGEIEISLSDILSLSETGELSVPLPDRDQVDLLLGGELIARASFSLNNEVVTLKIAEVFLQKDPVSCDNIMESEDR
ncbi:MAG TPA: FliM/FliN family flagellar motor switch protein [Oligoflexia bacterium]|nr:FliM/FliN family flagellar motor switch protein [Oligoflexia bacterium]HMP48802.1 FliM/FliN family flagellar motor switch protein [Oligoflexia bacterium]